MNSSKSLLLSVLLATASTLSLYAQTPITTGGKGLDLNGNGMSDLWEVYYGGTSLNPANDEDGDGRSNLAESLAGTNPFNAADFLSINNFTKNNSTFTFSWLSTLGKQYWIQWSDSLTAWNDTQAIVAGTGSTANTSVLIANSEEQHMFYRLKVADIDSDNDGLLAYEEQFLGFSDSSRNSTTGSSGTDYERAVALVAGGSPFSVGDKSASPTLPTLEESSRFLVQSTMGADYESIQYVSQIGFSSWLDEQFALPPTYHLPRNGQIALRFTENDEEELIRPFIWSWWDVNMTAPDVLRQRVAFALSEILVVSQVGSDTLEDVQWGLVGYYDLLVKHAFGNYQDLLYDVSMNPVMGIYLTHAKNRKADLSVNRFPDENYARELMQLFSIGLYQLNQNGTRKKDSQGNDIPTYTNTDIREFARVFTGLTYNPAPPSDDVPYFGDREDPFIIQSEQDFLDSDDHFLNQPMFAYEPLHDTEAKQLLSYTTVQGQTVDGRLPANQTTDQDIRAATSNLFNHPNTGPFVSRLLIQRLTKSNPSPGYISRVAAAFNDNGQGIRGEMKAVIRAILLDPEARNRGFLNDPTNGMLREPYIRYLQICRAFNTTTVSGIFRAGGEYSQTSFKQQPLMAPSVFNFFQPDHTPLGPIQQAGLVSPEFQITTATTSISTMNFWADSIGLGDFIFVASDGTTVDYATPDLSDEIELAFEPTELVDRLDLILTYGSMTQTAKSIITQVLTDAIATDLVDDWDLAHLALYLFANSPDFAVLK